MKIIAITQARYGSTRLPGKVLKQIDGISLLQIHISRILKSKKIDKLIVATTFEDQSLQIANIAHDLGVKVYRGSTQDVLDRYYQTAKIENPDWVVRITSDCPLIDSSVIDKVVNYAIVHDATYCSNVFPPTFPDGMDVEVFKFFALEDAWKNAKQPFEREHVTVYIQEKYKEKTGKYVNYENKEDCSKYRLTVDTQADFDLIEKLIKKLGYDKCWENYIDLIKSNPELFNINNKYKRNEGYFKQDM